MIDRPSDNPSGGGEHTVRLASRLAGAGNAAWSQANGRQTVAGIRFFVSDGGPDFRRTEEAVADSDNDPGLAILADAVKIGHRLSSEYVTQVISNDFRPPAATIVFAGRSWMSLEDRVRQEGPLSARTAIWITRQCAMGLRDLSRAGAPDAVILPEWIRCHRDGRVQVSLWRRGGKPEPISEAPSPVRPLTALPWIAAEIEAVKSLGRLAAWMLTARRPFVDVVGKTSELIDLDRSRLVDALHDAPEDFAHLVWAMIEPARHVEFRDWTAVIQRLTKIEVGEMGRVRPVDAEGMPAVFAV